MNYPVVHLCIVQYVSVNFLILSPPPPPTSDPLPVYLCKCSLFLLKYVKIRISLPVSTSIWPKCLLVCCGRFKDWLTAGLKINGCCNDMF